ncbi:MAG: hypothetical protein ACKVOB_07230 [Sphingomonas sp.]
MTTKTSPLSVAKVPAVTLGFWVIKILATTLGETAGDTLSMTFNWGYLASTGVFAGILAVLIWRQIAAAQYHAALYWATIIASTTAGTTLADFATRSLGIGYAGGSTVLATGVLLSLLVWRWALGSIAVETVHEPRAELFYWVTITLSQTLGTALGDWTADTGGLGYLGAAAIFAGLLALLAVAYQFTALSRVVLFWAAFILTRPLGAAVGDFLDKPLDHGGLDLNRPIASLVLALAIAACIALFPRRAAPTMAAK